jgi:hypothetical protein
VVLKFLFHKKRKLLLNERYEMKIELMLGKLFMKLTNDRGDVPGWVLVAVMTAGLVTAIWLIADDQLTGILDRAISSVSA